MRSPHTLHGVEIRSGATTLEWWAGHCGGCEVCAAGFEAWCPAYVVPEDGGDRWRLVEAPVLSDLEPAACAATAIVLDVLAHAEPADPHVLLVGLGRVRASVAEALARLGVEVTADDSADPARLGGATLASLESRAASGRADVVVTFGDNLDRCARWVRRGGTIATASGGGNGPALDMLTMREVRVSSVRRPHTQLIEGGGRP